MNKRLFGKLKQKIDDFLEYGHYEYGFVFFLIVFIIAFIISIFFYKCIPDDFFISLGVSKVF